MTEQRAASEPQIVTRTTRLSTNGRTSIVVEPPRPCGLTECAGEMHVTVGHDTTRIHLSARQRVELIEALGGVLTGAEQVLR